MKKYTVWIVGIIVVVIVVVFAGKAAFRAENTAQHTGVAGDPIDITLDFYNSWLASKKGGNDSTGTKDLLTSGFLSKEMQEKLRSFDFSSDETELDPVLCQTALPEGFRSKVIFETEDAVQMLVLSKDKEVFNQAVVSLESYDGLWEITDIYCNAGERGPEMGEFSFDTEGNLLKDSLPSTFNKEYWYLVFAENNVPGHTVPLLLDDESMCIDGGGATSVCKPNEQFSEAMQIHVQGQMTERGVTVNRIEFIPN